MFRHLLAPLTLGLMCLLVSGQSQAQTEISGLSAEALTTDSQYTPIPESLWSELGIEDILKAYKAIPETYASPIYARIARNLLISPTSVQDASELQQAELLHVRTRKLLKLGFFKEATALYEQSVKDIPDNPVLAVAGLEIKLSKGKIPETCLDVQVMQSFFAEEEWFKTLKTFCAQKYSPPAQEAIVAPILDDENTDADTQAASSEESDVANEEDAVEPVEEPQDVADADIANDANEDTEDTTQEEVSEKIEEITIPASTLVSTELLTNLLNDTNLPERLVTARKLSTARISDNDYFCHATTAFRMGTLSKAQILKAAREQSLEGIDVQSPSAQTFTSLNDCLKLPYLVQADPENDSDIAALYADKNIQSYLSKNADIGFITGAATSDAPLEWQFALHEAMHASPHEAAPQEAETTPNSDDLTYPIAIIRGQIPFNFEDILTWQATYWDRLPSLKRHDPTMFVTLLAAAQSIDLTDEQVQKLIFSHNVLTFYGKYINSTVYLTELLETARNVGERGNMLLMLLRSLGQIDPRDFSPDFLHKILQFLANEDYIVSEKSNFVLMHLANKNL